MNIKDRPSLFFKNVAIKGVNKNNLQLTYTYTMTNVRTGNRHEYCIFKKVKGYSNTDILEELKKDLQSFSAYTSGIFIVTSDIYVSDYLGRIHNVIKVPQQMKKII